MKKLLNIIKNHILLTTTIFTLIFALLCTLLNSCDIMFRQWVYYLSGLLIYIGFLGGIIQSIRNIKNKTFRNFIPIITILIGIFIVISICIILFLFIFGHAPEHIIEKENKKYVAYVHSFLKVDVYYYDYINFFIVGNKVKIHEYYGSGGYDPFDGEHDSFQPSIFYYYDDNGRVIDTNIKNYSSTESIQITIESGILTFIYDPNAENGKGKLMVSTNNSKTYIPCVVELPLTLKTNSIYIDGLPTYENNNLKLKVYSKNYQNSIKTYYNYTSKDGITWLYDSKVE